MVICGGRCWLNEEDVFTTDVFINADENFLVPKTFDIDASEGNVEHIGNVFRQSVIGGAADEFHGHR